MIRLVRVEMLRLLSRRLFRIGFTGVLLLITLIVTVDAAHHSKSSAGAYATFKAERLAMYDRAKARFDAQVGQPGGPRPGDQFQPSREQVERNPEGFCFAESAGSQGDGDPCGARPRKPYETKAALGDFGKAVAVICAFAAFLIGASAAGAEWSAGTMQSLLYWEPRRVRVVLAKVIGLVVMITALVIAAEALFSVLAVIAGRVRGTTAGLSAGVWASHLLLIARAAAFAGFAAVLGFSIAFATRVTAAAVGIAFIYFAVLERLLVAWKIWLARYLIGPLLGGWLNNGITTPASENHSLRLTGVRAGTTLAVYATVMLAAAAAWFRQRDVT